MKSTICALFIVSAFTFTSTQAAARQTEHRGSMVVNGESVKVFAAGPTSVHLFSMDRGGKFFTAPATTGTDADCVQAEKGAADRQKAIEVDRRNVIEVGAGEVACFASTSPRSFELLWHAHDTTAPANPVMVAQKR
jgi:hypothetical protein